MSTPTKPTSSSTNGGGYQPVGQTDPEGSSQGQLQIQNPVQYRQLSIRVQLSEGLAVSIFGPIVTDTIGGASIGAVVGGVIGGAGGFIFGEGVGAIPGAKWGAGIGAVLCGAVGIFESVNASFKVYGDYTRLRAYNEICGSDKRVAKLASKMDGVVKGVIHRLLWIQHRQSSLLDPLTEEIMVIPTRSSKCTQPHVYDASTWLSWMQEDSRCPKCRKKFTPTDLCTDTPGHLPRVMRAVHAAFGRINHHMPWSEGMLIAHYARKKKQYVPSKVGVNIGGGVGGHGMYGVLSGVQRLTDCFRRGDVTPQNLPNITLSAFLGNQDTGLTDYDLDRPDESPGDGERKEGSSSRSTNTSPLTLQSSEEDIIDAVVEGRELPIDVAYCLFKACKYYLAQFERVTSKMATGLKAQVTQVANQSKMTETQKAKMLKGVDAWKESLKAPNSEGSKPPEPPPEPPPGSGSSSST